MRLLLAVIFMASGFLKLVEPSANFLAVIHSYQVVTGFPARAFAEAIPWVELIAGAFLLAGLWIKFSTALLWVLNSFFIGIIAQAILRRLPVKDCGCFGEAFLSFTLPQALIFDIFTWVLLILLFLSRVDKRKLRC
jgi:putative oxidoreductase